MSDQDTFQHADRRQMVCAARLVLSQKHSQYFPIYIHPARHRLPSLTSKCGKYTNSGWMCLASMATDSVPLCNGGYEVSNGRNQVILRLHTIQNVSADLILNEPSDCRRLLSSSMHKYELLTKSQPTEKHVKPFIVVF